MFNFKICFTYPWLLLLLIPAAASILIPYFRINKRYRNTRNRITSMILHSIVMVLVVAILSGFSIQYVVPNKNNEAILVVDVSESEKYSETERDRFVEQVMEDCARDNINVGVVTFGFDQVYATPLETKAEEKYSSYIQAPLPDVTATNIAGALEYAASLFNHPETGKIVLITDARETDGDALNVISSVTAKGIAMDVAYVPSKTNSADAQIVGVTYPEQHVELGSNCNITLSIYSNAKGVADLRMYDNDVLSEGTVQENLQISEGTQIVTFAHTFEQEGLHEIRFEMEMEDNVTENNVYSSFYNLQLFNKVLIIERTDNSSEALIGMLNSEGAYNISKVNIFSEQLPATVDALRAYDQVILNDIADKDLPEGFDVALQTYVKEYGGGLFTLGGSNEDGSAHAYNKDSTNFNPIYHNMLPVEAVRYTPPIGVMFVIDSSGSMLGNNDYGTSIFESAKAAALACLDVLYDRDYVGIMTLDTNHATILELTPRTQETKIKEALGKLESSGGNTVFGDAVENAGLALRDLKNVAKRHIIVISDGKTEEESTYLPKIKDFYEKDGITFSVIGVAIPDDEARAAMKKACATGHGRFYEANSTKLLVESVKADLNVPKIEEVNNQPFAPIVNNPTSPLVLGLDRDATDKDRLTVKLGGFYGSRLKDGADLILVGEYAVPIYAQWKYGSGMVGSFLCDLQNTAWSSAFMQDENGQTFVKRAVNNLMPMQDLRPNDISVNLSEDNYTNTLSVFGKLGEGESIKGELVKITPTGESSVSLNEKTEIADDAKFYTTGALTALNKYSRCTFVIKEGGMYAIRLTKYDKEGKQVGNPYVVYKSFSYSEEYDEMTLEEEALKGFLTDTTTKSGGALIEDLTDTDPVVEGFVIELVKVFDPRTSFMIAAIVLFLLDIIVCKFKFKWIHEIIRDKKRKDSLR